MTDVHGEVIPKFAAVRDAFSRNFVEHGEVGAAFTAYIDGECVVDIWGGVADKTKDRPWDRDTLQLVFSCTKGATSVCANLLAERGELDINAPVTEYWPEFAAEGKGAIPVRWLLSHEAGLVALDVELTAEDAYRWTPVVDALAAQAPLWEPGTAHGYHAVTFGWLVGEVVRRITGQSLGAFFAKEVAEPLGLEFWIGLPPELEPRVSRLVGMGAGGESDGDDDGVASAGLTANLDPSLLIVRALEPVKGLSGAFNSPELHQAELPAANGICTSRSLARMYAGLIGEVDGVRILQPQTVDAARATVSRGPDKVLFLETHFGRGFMLPSAFFPMAGGSCFGHPGAGGAVGFADPERRIAVGYVMNRMLTNLAGDPRSTALVDALYASL